MYYFFYLIFTKIFKIVTATATPTMMMTHVGRRVQYEARTQMRVTVFQLTTR
jgi:hypothetical protein